MIQFDDQVTLKVKATLNHNYDLKRHPITLNTSLMKSTVSTFLYQIGLNLHFNRAPPSQPIWRQTRIFRSNSHRWCVRIICVYKLSVCTNRQCVYERISSHSSTGQLVYLEKCMLSIVEKTVTQAPRSWPLGETNSMHFRNIFFSLFFIFFHLQQCQKQFSDLAFLGLFTTLSS